MKNIKSEFEKLVLIALGLITVTQFGIWGHQSFFYILSQIFDVDTISTINDLVIGIIAMFGSVLIIVGVSYRIMEKTSAYKYIMNGAILFIIKNTLDLINEMIVFKSTTPFVDEFAISQLAGTLGIQLAQLGFWVFILVYYRNRSSAIAAVASQVV